MNSSHIYPYAGGIYPTDPPEEKEEAPEVNQEPSDSEIAEYEDKKSRS